jgi:hypothetical protein
MPVLPILCLLAAAGALALVDRISCRRPRLRAPATALAAIALCAQGLAFSVHDDLVLSRTDTRASTRAWLVAHVPPATTIAVEPVVTDTWLRDIGRSRAVTPDGARWRAIAPDELPGPVGRAVAATGEAISAKRLPDGQPLRRVRRPAGVAGAEGYVRELTPVLLDAYARAGVCWAITGSTQSGRAFAEPAHVPAAVAYYHALRRRARVVFRASPVRGHSGTGAFDFDWSFDYYPLRYHRPGPVVTVYRLSGGRCA